MGDTSFFKKKKLRVHVRIRKVGELLPASLIYDKKSKRFIVTLKVGASGLSDGQALVIYKPKSCEALGGGVIGG